MTWTRQDARARVGQRVLLEDSYFRDCARDAKGHCLPSGQSAATAAPAKFPSLEVRDKHGRKLSSFKTVAVRRKVLHGLRNESKLAKAIGGHNLPDSEPADVIWHVGPSGELTSNQEDLKRTLKTREEAVNILRNRDREAANRVEAAQQVLAEPLVMYEVKTLITAPKGTIRMSKKATARKQRWEERYGATFYTVAFDDRRGKKHSGHAVYLRRGVGSVKLADMEPVPSLEAVLERART